MLSTLVLARSSTKGEISALLLGTLDMSMGVGVVVPACGVSWVSCAGRTTYL